MSYFRMESPGKYQITIQGCLNADWSDRLGGLSIITTQSDDGQSVTILTGVLVDQAALLGVLNTLYDLRYPLLSLRRIEYCASDETSRHDNP